MIYVLYGAFIIFTVIMLIRKGQGKGIREGFKREVREAKPRILMVLAFMKFILAVMLLMLVVFAAIAVFQIIFGLP